MTVGEGTSLSKLRSPRVAPLFLFSFLFPLVPCPSPAWTYIAVSYAQVAQNPLFPAQDLFVVALRRRTLLLGSLPLVGKERRLLRVALTQQLCDQGGGHGAQSARPGRGRDRAVEGKSTVSCAPIISSRKSSDDLSRLSSRDCDATCGGKEQRRRCWRRCWPRRQHGPKRPLDRPLPVSGTHLVF